MKKEKFFISTAIDYVNGAPHIGHALEKIQADVLARYHRFLGENVFFLSGTDENSLKNVRAADREGIEIKDLVDRNAKKFHSLKRIFSLSFDDFIRTTEERHFKGAKKLWSACQNDIYKKKYKGLYCVGCEEFYKEEELENGYCPEHKRKPELVEEENYFFRLSQYEEQLKEIIKKDRVKVVPESRKNEVLSFIGQGLEDICISRSVKRAHGWGVPVPGDPSQIMWVWFDALSNYINALGYASDEEKFKYWWKDPSYKVHIIGKGILRFHAVYWPGMLLSADLPLPEEIFVHGYITCGGEKMSKSLGNIIDPFKIAKEYGKEAVRYFLLREVVPTKDGDFTREKLEKRYNDDLAKGLGNLTSRILGLIQKAGLKSEFLEFAELEGSRFNAKTEEAWEGYRELMDNFRFNETLILIWGLIAFCDRYIEKERVWEKEKGQKVALLGLCYVLENIAQMLEPLLPSVSEKILTQLGIEKEKRGWFFKIKETAPLFPQLK